MRTTTVLHGLLGASIFLLGSCVSPGDFDQNILSSYQAAMVQHSPQRRDGNVGLSALQPSRGFTGPRLNVVKKNGKSVIYLTLDEAIQRSLANNLDIAVSSFDPAITREQTIQAAAAFDAIFFSSFNFQKSDSFTTNPFGNFGGTARGLDTFQYQYAAGFKGTTVTGAQWNIAPTFTQTVTNSNAGLFHNVWQPGLVGSVTQPLLRNGWPEFTLAQLHIAQVNYKISVQQFRDKVDQIVNDTITAYWTLLQNRETLAVEEELLRQTIVTRDRIQERLKIDATMVELKQAEAAVETRRAVLYRSAKNIQDAQDNLAKLMTDAQVNLLERYEIVPASMPSKVPVKIDPADQLVLGLVHSPAMEQARLAIQGSEINVRVAQNQTLPKLDLTATFNFQGLDRHFDEANENFWDFDHLNYGVLLNFEYPIGNRQAKALLQQRQYERLQNITKMQNTADQLAVAINERIRQINTNYQEMQAQRLAVEAAATQLEALNDQEKLRGRLSPEFLNVKLQAQSTLAESELAMLQAVASYNAAMGDLDRLTGTILMQHGIDVQKMPAVTGEKPWNADQGTGPALPVAIPITTRTSLPTLQ